MCRYRPHHACRLPAGLTQRCVRWITYESLSYVAMNNAFCWTFEHADELQPAGWRFELTIDALGPRPLTLTQCLDVILSA